MTGRYTSGLNRWRLPVASLLATLWLLGNVRSGQAEIERHAVIIGNNQGLASDKDLRYAQSDAMRLGRVLQDLGGFYSENVVTLLDADADAVRRAIISVNDRIRSRPNAAQTQAVLLVYYSGHADANALHLGPSTLALRQLEQLVRGSSADVRLLILDSCHSGTVNRVKGGAVTAPFSVRIGQRLASEGMVVLTASSANEEAQESDRLKGSFFTHYLLSGLLGAADRNRDGRVSLSEVYRYAYDNTLRASSRTWLGPQHPTFRYDLRGRDDIVMTRIPPAGGARATLSLPRGRSYLLMRKSASGAVVAEVGVHDTVRQLSVRPGRYFVLARARDHLLEGSVTVRAGQSLTVRDSTLRRIQYARFVRKGGGGVIATHGVFAGYQVRTALAETRASCHGGQAGYRQDRHLFTVSGAIYLCRSSYQRQHLASHFYELAGELRVTHTWDLPAGISLAPGIAVGVGALHQDYTTPGNAPARTTAHGYLGVVASATVDVYGGMFVGVDATVQTYLLRLRDSDGSRISLSIDPALRAVLAVGRHF